MNFSQDLSQAVINLTYGAFDVPYFKMFKKMNGIYRPHIQALKRFIFILEHHSKQSITLKIAAEGKLGDWGKGGYINGVLKMLQQKEIDGCFIPVPIDIYEPPGEFLSISAEQEFSILSSAKDSNIYAFNVLTSLSIISTSTWLSFIAMILVTQILLQTRIHLSLSPKKKGPSYLRIIWGTICAIFRQYQSAFKQLCFSRILEMFFVSFFMIVFSSGFSTNAVVGDIDYRINTLEDVLKTRRPPTFIEGESRQDIFYIGPAQIYREVFKFAQQSGTSRPAPLNPNDMIETYLGGNCILASSRCIRTAVPLIHHLYQGSGKPYISAKPYHRSLLSFLTNLRFHGPLRKEYKRRNYLLSMRLFQSGLSQFIMEKIPDNLLEIFEPFEITFTDMSSRDHRSEQSTNAIQPLSRESLETLLYLIACLYAFSFLVFIFTFVVDWRCKKVSHQSKG